MIKVLRSACPLNAGVKFKMLNLIATLNVLLNVVIAEFIEKGSVK